MYGTVMDFKSIINELQEIIYVSDVETYELYFLNDVGVKHLGIESYKNKKCYEVLQGKDTPCEFCTNHMLNNSDFYVWEHRNNNNGHYYILKDKLIDWHGKLCRMETAIDITEKENTGIAVKEELETASTLAKCAHELSTNSSLNDAINIVLEKICQFHKADRAYIFEYLPEKEIIRNSHEYCSEGVEPQIEFLQEVPTPLYWFKHFKNRENIIIENLEDTKDIAPDEYEVLKPQGITSLMVVPFFKNNQCVGFIGVDNPTRMFHRATLLESLAYFFIAEIMKHKVENRLEYMSYHDTLTGVSNRNKYIDIIENSDTSSLQSLGVAFIDLNGLKEINDLYGHNSGDDAIKSVCNVIKKHFRYDDIYRIGGDEFTLICNNIPKDIFTQRIDAIKKDINSSGKYTVALGSVWQDKDINIALMTEIADKLMYEDKENFYRLRREGSVNTHYETQNHNNTNNIDNLLLDKTVSYEALTRGTFNHIFRIDVKNNTVKHLYDSGDIDFSDIEKNLYENTGDIYYSKLHPNDRKIFQENWNAIIQGKTNKTNFEYRFMTKDKSYQLTGVCIVKDSNDNIVIGLKNLSYILDKNRVYYDHITKLMNLEMFYKEVATVLNEHTDKKYYMIMLDIDKFKTINDIYGMEIGDNALTFIADVLLKNIKSNEICAKVYADTFCMLKSANTDNDLLKFLDRLSIELMKWNFGKLLKSYYGIARITDVSLSPVTICDMASYAHKEAKEKSVKYLFYNENMRLKDLEIKQIEQEMEKALKEEQFKVYLQPKYNTKDKKIVGAEALVRWHHPNKGIISPVNFIPLFEDNGFIVKLEHYVWDKVCQLIQNWMNEGKDIFPISVNVSRIHLQETDFLNNIITIYEKRNLPPKVLELEFTESLFTENIEHFINIAQTLQNKNITVVMDDFGSGYSSLNLLKKIPVDVIKLDCGFFRDSSSVSKREKIILSHTINMANELGTKIVAEGVGTQEQVDFLIKHNCPVIQGYFFSKPVTVAEFEKIAFENNIL